MTYVSSQSEVSLHRGERAQRNKAAQILAARKQKENTLGVGSPYLSFFHQILSLWGGAVHLQGGVSLLERFLWKTLSQTHSEPCLPYLLNVSQEVDGQEALLQGSWQKLKQESMRKESLLWNTPLASHQAHPLPVSTVNMVVEPDAPHLWIS